MKLEFVSIAQLVLCMFFLLNIYAGHRINQQRFWWFFGRIGMFQRVQRGLCQLNPINGWVYLMTRCWFQTFLMFTLTWRNVPIWLIVFYRNGLKSATRWTFWGPGTFDQLLYVFFMTWCFRLKVFFPIPSMYGICHYIWLLFYGKCRGTCTIRGCYVYMKKDTSNIDIFSPPPNVSCVLGGGMAGWSCGCIFVGCFFAPQNTENQTTPVWYDLLRKLKALLVKIKFIKTNPVEQWSRSCFFSKNWQANHSGFLY